MESVPKNTIFGLQMIVKSGLDFFYFEFQRTLSEIAAKLARPFQPFWADIFALGSSNSEGA